MAGRTVHSPRGMQVHAVRWTAEDGTQVVELFAAKGGKGSRATHKTAQDRLDELLENSTDDAEIHSMLVV